MDSPLVACLGLGEAQTNQTNNSTSSHFSSGLLGRVFVLLFCQEFSFQNGMILETSEWLPVLSFKRLSPDDREPGASTGSGQSQHQLGTEELDRATGGERCARPRGPATGVRQQVLGTQSRPAGRGRTVPGTRQHGRRGEAR